MGAEGAIGCEGAMKAVGAEGVEGIDGAEGAKGIRRMRGLPYIQGAFFYWSALKMTKCQPLQEFSELVLPKYD